MIAKDLLEEFEEKTGLAPVGEVAGPSEPLLRLEFDIATGSGVLRLLELQRPGKRRMAVADYLNAGNLPGFLPSPSTDDTT